jgi:hypothetical protein
MKAEDREEGRSGSFFSGFVQFQERGKFWLVNVKLALSGRISSCLFSLFRLSYGSQTRFIRLVNTARDTKLYFGYPLFLFCCILGYKHSESVFLNGNKGYQP